MPIKLVYDYLLLNTVCMFFHHMNFVNYDINNSGWVSLHGCSSLAIKSVSASRVVYSNCSRLISLSRRRARSKRIPRLQFELSMAYSSSSSSCPNWLNWLSQSFLSECTFIRLHAALPYSTVHYGQSRGNSTAMSICEQVIHLICMEIGLLKQHAWRQTYGHKLIE